MAFKDLSLPDKIVAVHADFMRHANFCILGGVTQIGKVEVSDAIPTAGTDGVDVVYGASFIADMTRKQLRYLVGHENMHKALHHCSIYKDIAEKYPQEFAQAVDYVVNWQLESMDDGDEKFLERPTKIPPLIDAKYADMSVPEVVRELLKNGKKNPQQPMDQHVQMVAAEATEGDGESEGEGQGLTQEELEAVKQQIEDAVRHGEIMQQQLRSAQGKGTTPLKGFREQRTDWRGPLKRFMKENGEGDDQSRYAPPNRRLLPLDVCLPSRFTVKAGEILVACDTSGTMGSVYPIVFGEIANIAKMLQPKSLRVLWWDTHVAGEQVFTERDYDKIAKLVKPKGGGGTTVSCVAAYVKANGIKPKATIYLTDGYVESHYSVVPGPLLWGVVGNERFVPLRGKVLHIHES